LLIMNLTPSPTRRRLTLIAASLAGATAASAITLGLTAAGAATSAPRHHAEQVFSFLLKAPPPVAACLPHAGGRVTITKGSINDTMRVTVHGMPPKSGFDLFVIQQPTKPFGVSWYQSDLQTDRNGNGTATVRGIFNKETFSVSPGGTTTFAPTHQFHLGLWFNNPRTPFNLGCEPGAPSAIVTPFNGEQHAGIQALNTAQFPVNRGPLSHVRA
jgi:hypothetical protein